MKKLTAILLLALFLVNLIGYRGWFYFAEQQWEAQLQNSLDNAQYNEADLITLKVPLTLPYVTDTKDFQRTDGEVAFNGKLYHYVKSKIQNGSYILQCLPDNNKERLEKAKQDFFKYANDLVQTNSSKKSGSSNTNVLKILLFEYDQYPLHFNLTALQNSGGAYRIQRNTPLLFIPHQAPEHPPKAGIA